MMQHVKGEATTWYRYMGDYGTNDDGTPFRRLSRSRRETFLRDRLEDAKRTGRVSAKGIPLALR